MKLLATLFVILICCGAFAQKPLFINKPQNGKASFYGHKFEGRKTSNGEIFSNSNLTAAHKSLPFNSIVRVTVQHNRRFVFVRINDRGPFVKGRIIDLTDAATVGLDFKHAGTEDVEVRLCEEIQLTKELEANFKSGEWCDALGNKVSIKRKSLSVAVLLSLEHALYIASDLYDDPALHDIAVKSVSVGNVKRYIVLIHNIDNDAEIKSLASLLYGRGYVNAKKY